MRYLEEFGSMKSHHSVANGPEATDMVALLRAWATQKPNAVAYLFLADGETESAHLSFAGLDLRARAIAAHLRDRVPPGERALLLYPPGLEYVVAFFGCLYAGIVAVPAYPPSRQHLARLLAVIEDADPAVILTTAELAAKFRDGWTASSPGSEKSEKDARRQWLATDTLGTDWAERWRPPLLEPASLAFLQYTSGSTGDPKGVMVSHGNLIANQEDIRQSFGHTEQSTVVGWLPLYHDMGLIGNILQPLYAGSTAVLMPPLAFLEKPVRWLRAISAYGAATSGGPNFAYDLCARKVTAEQKHGLDLSGWTLAFNGAEPVRAATLERFADAFAECGFRRESFFPCYGLAEATLFVTGERLEEKKSSSPVPTSGLQPQASNLTPCGHPWTGHEVRIVDPDTRRLCAEGQVGEIWVAGPSVAQGYWNRPDESERTFRARLETGDLRLEKIQSSCLPHPAFIPEPTASSLQPQASPTTFLRTGDLGFLDRGRLHVSGRIKDLIIVRGRNFHPQDIEHALTDRIEALRPGGCAAFSLDGGDEERVAVIAEIGREALRKADFITLLATMRRILAEECELAAAELALVPPGAVPKTSSGKLRRRACKQAYTEGSLSVLARSGDVEEKAGEASGPCNGNGTTAAGEQELQLLRQALFLLPQPQRTPLIAGFLRARTARLLKIGEADLPLDASLRALGLDSLKAVELKHAVDDLLGIEAPLSLLLSEVSLEEAAEALAGKAGDLRLEAGGEDRLYSSSSSPQPTAYSLSAPQLAMWAMHQMEPDSIVYNLHLALRIEGRIDEDLLRQAFDRLAQRHDILRTVYRAEGDRVSQTALPLSGLRDYFAVVDASALSETEFQDDMARRVREPFNLVRGPVFRAVLYRHGPEPQTSNLKPQACPHTLLLCAHHIALDLWSLLILLDELKTVYTALAQGREPQLPGLSAGYRDFVSREAGYLAGPNGEKAWEFWRTRLSGELPRLALPTDRSGPKTPGYRGASRALRLGAEETRRLKALAGRHGATLFALLLAAYKVLLHRHTHQTDLIVGVPASGRSQSRFAPLVGLFVNPVPLRTHPAAGKSFAAYLAEVRDALLGALEHQDFPFPLMVERLQPERTAEHWPIYQTLFVLQRAQAGIASALAQLALGEDGEPLDWSDWRAQPLAVRERIENFDLKLMAAECGDGLLFSFQYRSDRFDPDTIDRWAQRFEVVLRGIAADPEARLGDLPLLTEAEHRLVLTEWNAVEDTRLEERHLAEPSAPISSLPPPAYSLGLHELFEQQTARQPERMALVCGEAALTYGELNERAETLACHLRTRGVGPETRVGLCLERSVEAIVGLFAILKAGGAYVPLNPDQPKERITEILADCGAALLLTQQRLAARGPAGVDILCLDGAGDWSLGIGREENRSPHLQPESAAYLIYTSGSTGQPKGVVVSHANAVASTLARFRFYPEPVEGFLLLSSFAFDSSVAGIFWTLSQGGRLCIPAEDSHQDVEALADLVARERLTHLLCLPSLYNLLLDCADSGRLDTLRTAIVAGEACPPGLAAKHHRTLPATRLYNEYGPTEGTVWCSGYEIPATAEPDRSVSIGRPIANTRIYLLDAQLNPVPIGVPGELYIGGAGVARGYHGRPELTAERFVPDPFSEAPGSRLYRTGDLARWRPDGTLEFLGRTDHQVKLRGFRIELGEIEAHLLRHPRVREAVAVVREDSPGARRLVAYAVASPDPDDGNNPLTGETLRAFLRDSLPDYMAPAACMVLDALPLTPNGKPDRKALPAPDRSGTERYAPPRNAAETQLAEIWAEVLRVERVGIHDNFFDLGGESILAIQAASRAHKAGFAVTPRHLFQYQTIAELAEAVRHSAATGEEAVKETAAESPAEAAPGHFSLSRLAPEEVAALPRGIEEIEDIYPLTPLQEGMLFHTLMAPRSGIYLMQDRFELQGEVDVAVFRDAWDRVIRRHPVLRTGFVWETRSAPHQIVYKTLDVPFEYFDWRHLHQHEQDSCLDILLRAELEEGFDLARPPLLKLRLFRLGDDRYRFVRSHHHILLDAWCTSLILTEFKSCYDALVEGKSPVEEAAAPFRHYIAWLQDQDGQAAGAFWRGYLAGFHEPTPLVVDRAAAADESTEVADIAVQLSETATRQLYELAQRWRLTPNTFVQGAWAVLLSRYAGVREVLFGVTVAGRPAELPQVEEILGLFINGLPLRVKVDPAQPVAEFLHGLLRQNLDLRQYEYTALPQIQAWCELPRGQELFQHLLTFENAPIDPVLRKRTGTFGFTDVTVRTHTNYPITVMVIPEDCLHLQISYRKARFEATTVERMLRHFQTLLEDMIAHPAKQVGELAMLTALERRQIAVDWNRTDRAYPEPTDVVAWFETQAERRPYAVAAACQGQSLTYRKLNARANRLAHALIDQGVGPEVLVALLSDRGLDFLVMMLGVFKAGGAYLPLDPAHPDGRLAQVLAESRASLVLAGGEAYRERARTLVGWAEERSPTTRVGVPLGFLSSAQPTTLALEDLESQPEQTHNPARRHAPRSLAFTIFTSGSTGTPKGAMVEHRGMFNNLITKVPTLELTEADVIAQTAGQCFDISVWQHLTPLVCGGRVEIFPDEVVKEPHHLLAQLAERGVTILEAVPSMIQALLDLAGSIELPGLRWLIACGEAFPPDLCRRWMQRFPHVRVLNAYGPAECSDDVSYYEVPVPPAETDTVVPIGWPVDNTRLYLLDARLDLVPVGVPGEICVAGIQVGRGYLHRPELTAERFVPDPFDTSGQRLYRTGDLGRYRADGAIEFLGRIDHQVKIRGFRIEPGEIETQILKHPRVEQALVVAREDGRSGKRLVAYVVSQDAVPGADAMLADELRAWLGVRLPNYMVPSAFVRLDAMPLGANGKIDRKRLPAPDSIARPEELYVAPRNPTEDILAGIWKEVLGVERVGVHDGFFDLGGHSLLAVQVLARVRAAFGIDIPLGRLFEAATVEQLALAVEDFLIGELDGLSEEEALALLESDA